MNYKSLSTKILSWLLVIILVAIAAYCLITEYMEFAPNGNEKESIKTNLYTKDGYLILDESNNDRELVRVTEIIENEDNTYSFKGIKLKRYTVDENEYDHLKNQVPLVIDSVNYYFTWSDEYNEYIFISEKNDNIYYLKKDNVSNEYMVINLSSSEEPYEDTETKVQIKVEKELVDENTKEGKYKFEYENGKCISVTFIN